MFGKSESQCVRNNCILVNEREGATQIDLNLVLYYNIQFTN